MMAFTHLHVHTEYSSLDGMAKVDDLVSKAKELGFSSLAITDHGTVRGLVAFYRACVENPGGIKPILGIESYFCNNRHERDKTIGRKGNFHLVLLAKNNEGYHNILRLSEKSYMDGFYYDPRIDYELLNEHRNGIIALTACLDGPITAPILEGKHNEAITATGKLKEIFGEDLYIELMYHGIKKQADVMTPLLKISKQNAIKTVATNDVHFTLKDDWFAHEVLLCISTNRSMRDPSRFSMGEIPLHLRSEEEMREVFSPELEESLMNTQEVDEKCDVKIDRKSMRLGEVNIPEGFANPDAYLEHLIWEGFSNRGLPKDEKYVSRIKHELDTIRKTKFAKYFLLVRENIAWAKSQEIRVGLGRGSGASSLALYCLGITGIDPLKYDLLFERFLTEGRVQDPDIDTDFQHDRRDEVNDMITKKYGKEKVARIGTNSSFQPKGLMRRVTKAIDPFDDFATGGKASMELGDQLSKYINQEPDMTLEKAYGESPELSSARKDPRYAPIFAVAERLEGVASRPGIHASGIVVCNVPLCEVAPLHTTKNAKSAENLDNICTQFGMEDLEYLGLVKIDNLGLNTLTVIDRTVKLIKKVHGCDINIDGVNLTDKRTLQLFANGDTTGIFQFESPGMRKMLKDIRPTCIEDLIAAVALYRPGCIRSGTPAKYAARKNGKQKIEAVHPLVAQCLEKTFAVPIYQEDIMRLSRVLAGFDASQADMLRKAMGKKKSDIFLKMEKQWYDGCAKNGIPRYVAESVWIEAQGFAGYAFNKSHAAVYAILAFQTAALKVHFEREFMISMINVEAGDSDYDKVYEYIGELKRLGRNVQDPCVNRSESLCVPEGDKGIRVGLLCVKGIGSLAAEAIASLKPYNSVSDLMMRLPNRVVTNEVLKLLTEAGALDCLGPRDDIISNLDDIRRGVKKSASDGTGGLLPPIDSGFIAGPSKISQKDALKAARRPQKKKSSEPEAIL
jgi:DNA polymerase-3 subunit alpha